MSEYVEKCPCCSNHSLEVTQHDPDVSRDISVRTKRPGWGEERRCELCGFARSSGRPSGGADRAVAPSVPTQAHAPPATAPMARRLVGNAVACLCVSARRQAFVSAACGDHPRRVAQAEAVHRALTERPPLRVERVVLARLVRAPARVYLDDAIDFRVEHAPVQVFHKRMIDCNDVVPALTAEAQEGVCVGGILFALARDGEVGLDIYLEKHGCALKAVVPADVTRFVAHELRQYEKRHGRLPKHFVEWRCSRTGSIHALLRFFMGQWPPPTPMHPWLERLEKQLAAKGLRQTTRAYHLRMCRAFLAFLESHAIPLEDVSCARKYVPTGHGYRAVRPLEVVRLPLLAGKECDTTNLVLARYPGEEVVLYEAWTLPQMSPRRCCARCPAHADERSGRPAV